MGQIVSIEGHGSIIAMSLSFNKLDLATPNSRATRESDSPAATLARASSLVLWLCCFFGTWGDHAFVILS
jgi:hypothetical protein